MMEFKGYIAKVAFDDDASVFHGEVINTRDVITFQGSSVKELKREFRASVEDYIDFCSARGEAPDKPFSGQFMTRVSPELHKEVTVAAVASGKSLNGWVTEQLQSAVRNSRSPRSVVKASAKRPARRSVKATRKRQ